MNNHLAAEFWLVLNAICVAPVTAKLSSKTVISKKKTRDSLKAKQKQLKRHGLGNRPKPTTALTDDFGLRGCKEQLPDDIRTSESLIAFKRAIQDITV